MDIIRRPLLVALTTLLGAALIACGDDTKKDAASAKPAATLKGDGFSVEMPGKPKRQVLTAPTAAGPLPVTAYITEGGDEGYSMSVLKVPKGGRFDLDGAIQGAAANVNGSLKDRSQTSYQGYPARDARITNAADKNGNKGTVFARVILAEGRVFQLQFVTGGGNVKSAPAAYTRFVSSLRIG
jgi:hypothetical protein